MSGPRTRRARRPQAESEKASRQERCQAHRSDPAFREVTPLTARELEVLSLIGLGMSARKIAGQLTISYHTARNHVRNVCGKLQARSKVEAVVIAKSRNLL